MIIPTGERKGQNPGLASIYRALAEHEKRQAYPEAVEAAHTDFATFQVGVLLPNVTSAARRMCVTFDDLLIRRNHPTDPGVAAHRPSDRPRARTIGPQLLRPDDRDN
ncbi:MULTISPECIES: hypothetical protein [Streptosporangium]|uniref:Resolvase/invertase-type recombinase catalytic domain-containing protein n=1 Tax=Streptosporangium brasiliense TaxID=47480 RepID=A0ABT9RIV6_9ACTN|nr:hypothetical protein [Streptosporangium brasiliense]MDP9868639.1 hypothetical protein [Streptosporangium brasiliense]